MNENSNVPDKKVIILIIVAALGYFVDIYDMVLFGVVKAESLSQIMIGYSIEKQASTGKFLFNMQMLGMLVGGLLWGVLGDKKGRIKVLFGSILLYSIANLLNAFVTDITSYAIIRVVAGIGLAGELGAGITLVSEMMSKEKRGYGTMIIVTFGALGAVVASLVGAEGQIIGDFIYSLTGTQLANWQVTYIVGGMLGVFLLLLRVGTIESSFFEKMSDDKTVSKGNLKIIFFNKKNFIKYLHCIVIGIPIWYVVGLLVMNSSDNFAPLLGIKDINNGTAVMYTYIGLSFGDLISGLLSQLLKSRKKVVAIYLVFTLILVTSFLFFMDGISVDIYYLVCFLLGTATGYWALFVSIAAEQFGTNIRSTTANTIPNFVRGSVNLIMISFGFLMGLNLGDAWSAYIVGLVFILMALYSLSQLKETFGKDLNYFEEE
ncbi:MAG: MFS transporter [Flavobacteriales bacterium]|nr:MFS transporter [Flavobacteriales bacterium]